MVGTTNIEMDDGDYTTLIIWRITDTGNLDETFNYDDNYYGYGYENGILIDTPENSTNNRPFGIYIDDAGTIFCTGESEDDSGFNMAL